MFTFDVHRCFALFGVLMWFTVTCYLRLLILLLSIRIYYFDIRPILQVPVDSNVQLCHRNIDAPLLAN